MWLKQACGNSVEERDLFEFVPLVKEIVSSKTSIARIVLWLVRVRSLQKKGNKSEKNSAFFCESWERRSWLRSYGGRLPDSEVCSTHLSWSMHVAGSPVPMKGHSVSGLLFNHQAPAAVGFFSSSSRRKSLLPPFGPPLPITPQNARKVMFIDLSRRGALTTALSAHYPQIRVNLLTRKFQIG